MSNPKHYTAKDMERYHQGGMTAAEMHQLERAALNDPMLADALEGYRFSQAPSAELAGLQRRLQQRIEGAKKEQRTVWLPPWMRVAALFVFMAGAGWLVLQTFSTRENDLATRTPALHREERQAESIAADSAAPVSGQTPSAFSPDSHARDRAANPARPGRTLPAPKTETSAPVTRMKRSGTADKNRLDVSPEVADAAPAPAQNDVAILQAPTPPAVAMQQTDSAADSMAQPVQGWKAFEEYIAKNRKPVLPRNKKQEAESSVELTFSVNQQGRPVNIVVTQSGNKAHNEEAIRLLKEGPAWKGKSGKVTIHFPF